MKMLGAVIMRLLAFEQTGVAQRVTTMPGLVSVLRDAAAQAADAKEPRKAACTRTLTLTATSGRHLK